MSNLILSTKHRVLKNNNKIILAKKRIFYIEKILYLKFEKKKKKVLDKSSSQIKSEYINNSIYNMKNTH